MNAFSERQQEVRQSIREFFDAAAKQRSETKVCPECGDQTKGVAATFSLSGTDLTWTIPLTTCDCTGQENNPKAA